MSDSECSHSKSPRTLVLCFDGTDNQFDGTNTNVVKLFSLLKKDNFDEQLCYYQAGIGTYFNPGVVSPLFQWAAAKLDSAVAWYLDQHVMDGYEFLVQNYRAGDKICLFGFSRGSYTARALAGMLFKVGLLPMGNAQQIPFAYKLYKRTDKQGLILSAGFKETFCQHVDIEFVGVWDTVCSVGLLTGRTLPFVGSNTAIKTFRHALSLDEHRAKFRPNLYHRPAPNSKAAARDPEHASPVLSGLGVNELPKILRAIRPKFMKRPSLKKKKEKSIFSSPEKATVSISEDETDVLEVWFSGCHSDVGGGAVSDSTPSSLSDISLMWMVRQIMAVQCGIQFDHEAMRCMSIPTTTFPPGTSTISGPQEKKIDREDAMQPIHDQLKLDWAWWLLEIIPLSYSWQDEKGVWHKKWSFHLGSGRFIPCKPCFHITVQERMQNAALKYKPRAVWTHGTETYVQ